MTKRATTDHPVHDLVAARWSPYAFSDRPVDDADLRALFEAARWAPSSFNEQPWRYVVATKRDPAAFATALACLVEGNQRWARNAWALAFGVASLRFARNGKPNRAAVHDLGLASATLTFEATARGLSVHQMIGILPERVVESYGIPDGHEALTGLAIGWRAHPGVVPEDLAERDRTPRTRKPLAEIVFTGSWGRPY